MLRSTSRHPQPTQHTGRTPSPATPLQLDRSKASSLTLQAITKTVSNYFFKPEKLPLALEERVDSKVISRPFYAKNRRMIAGKPRREEPLPNGFQNMLRAKSTVIRQKKLQEFYISKEARPGQLEGHNFADFIDQNSKSNLFRSNVPIKRTRHKGAHSGSFERKPQPSINLNNEVIKMPAKAMTIHALTEDLAQMALKDKPFFNNQRKGEHLGVKIAMGNFRRRRREVRDKENIEFQLEPWKAVDNDDVFF